jgi:hypothetical protein
LLRAGNAAKDRLRDLIQILIGSDLIEKSCGKKDCNMCLLMFSLICKFDDEKKINFVVMTKKNEKKNKNQSKWNELNELKLG